MNLMPPEILTRLVRRFGLLVVLTLIGAAAGGIYAAVKTPTYTAQSYVVVTGEAGEPFAAVNYAQAYGRIVTQGPVADRAAAALGSRAGLDRVTATTSPDAPVIEITATGTDANRTANVANAVAQALVDFGATRKTETRVSLSVLATASVPGSPTSPKPPLELAIGAAAGLLIAGLATLAGVGRPRRAARPTAAQPIAANPSRYDPRPAEQPRPRRALTASSGDPDNARPIAITWYTEDAASEVSVPAEEQSDVGAPTDTPATGDGRVVGRAAVVYRDDDE